MRLPFCAGPWIEFIVFVTLGGRRSGGQARIPGTRQTSADPASYFTSEGESTAQVTSMVSVLPRNDAAALNPISEISSVHDETLFLALSQLNEGCRFSSSTNREQECSKSL